MAAGKQPLSDEERSRIEVAVQASERSTGLQFLVYLGKSKKDTRAHAIAVLASQGYHELPGVLVFVSPQRRAIEIVTSDEARKRINDDQARRAVDIMVPALRKGDWIAGIELGLAALTEEAGAPAAGSDPSPDMPDII